MEAAALRRCKAALLADPSLISATESAVRLLRARHGLTDGEARRRLARLTASDLQTLLDEIAPDGRYEMGALEEALGFPVFEDYFFEMVGEMDDDEDRNYITIPIVGLNHLDAYEVFEEWPVHYQLAYLINRPADLYKPAREDTAEEQARWAHFRNRLGLPESLRPTGGVTAKNLYGVFKRERTPLRHLMKALEMTEYSTGCIFFDFSNEMEMDADIEWSADHVDWLRRDYQLCERIGADIEDLRAWIWIDDDAAERVSRALLLYEKARRMTNARQNETRVRVAARATGGTLVTIL